MRVRLRFSVGASRYVAERTWHPTQTLAPLLTGELDLALRVPICPELKRWILGYGREAEVLAPKSLRSEIRREWLAALRGPAAGSRRSVWKRGRRPAPPTRRR